MIFRLVVTKDDDITDSVYVIDEDITEDVKAGVAISDVENGTVVTIGVLGNTEDTENVIVDDNNEVDDVIGDIIDVITVIEVGASDDDSAIELTNDEESETDSLTVPVTGVADVIGVDVCATVVDVVVLLVGETVVVVDMRTGSTVLDTLLGSTVNSPKSSALAARLMTSEIADDVTDVPSGSSKLTV